MAIRKILKLGDPLLREIAEEVPQEEILSKEIKKIVRDMFDTMYSASGLGLAAPQIGILKRIVVVAYEEENSRYPSNEENQIYLEPQVFINPSIEMIKEKKSSLLASWEGCLSVPGMRGYVERPSSIKMTWYDQKAQRHEKVVEGFEAIVYQHECDHLDGILYVDRLKSTKLFGFVDEMDAED